MADPISAPPATGAYMEQARAVLASMMQDDAVSDPERLESLVKIAWYAGDLINDTMDRMRETMTDADIGVVLDRIGKPPKRKRKRSR